MARPRLLLVPEFTELAWGTIRRDLAEWAEVASYDPPGVGAEPIADGDIDAIRRGDRSIHDLFARRGMDEVDRRGWDRFFVASDGWGNAAATRLALERPDAVRGMALGHASLSYDMDGEGPAVSREIWAAMGQLLRQDHREFIRHGIVQMTRGSVTDEVAAEMLDRFPDTQFVEVTWEALGREHQPIGEMLKEYGGPLLLAQHVGCLSFTDEGFRDAVAAFPDARVLRVPQAPSIRPEFVEALRQFCESVVSAEAGARS
ncbi:MAG: alpha/beta fold hydrolase [Solirubrobacterales bacterium]